MRNLFLAFATLSLMATAATAAHAAASDLDDCILDITYQCLDYDTVEEFWECYHAGRELCENQSAKEIQSKPKREIVLIETNAKRRAETLYRKHQIGK